MGCVEWGSAKSLNSVSCVFFVTRRFWQDQGLVIGVCSFSACSQQSSCSLCLFVRLLLRHRHPNAVVGLDVVLMRTRRTPDTETWVGVNMKCGLKGVMSCSMNYEMPSVLCMSPFNFCMQTQSMSVSVATAFFCRKQIALECFSYLGRKLPLPLILKLHFQVILARLKKKKKNETKN